jgi:hypothetical protein
VVGGAAVLLHTRRRWQEWRHTDGFLQEQGEPGGPGAPLLVEDQH